MCIGVAIGAVIGVATDKLALWMGMGPALGLAFGATFEQIKKDNKDQKEKKD